MRHYALALGMAGTSPAMTLEIQSCLSVRFGFDFQTARARGACPIRAKDALHRPYCYDGAGAPETLMRLAPNEGARNAGCASASAAPCAKVKKHTSVVATVTPFSSGVPHAVGGTACFALSPVDGLFRHRSGNYDLPPSSRTKRRLAVSVRRQHRGARTTRLQPSASCAVVIRHTFHVPDLTPHAATASRPAYRDDRETPLMTGAGRIGI